MAIKLEFCNLIVPVESIRDKLGNEAFETQFSTVTETTWHDGLLFRDGCMDHYVLKDMLDEWQSWGFEPLTTIGGAKHWKDLCVVNSHYGPSYPCEWIEYDRDKNIVWLKGHEPGVSVGPVGRNVAGEDPTS